MKIAYYVSIFILLLPLNSLAADPWTKEQKFAEIACLSVIIIDWGQTLDIAKKPDQYEEQNPFIGKHPSTSDVNRAFLIGIAIHPIVTHLLPGKYRKYWQGFTFGISMGLVVHNNSIGLRVNF